VTRSARSRGFFWAGVVAIAAIAVTVRFWRLGWGLDNGGFLDEQFFLGQPGQKFVPLTCASFETKRFIYPTLYLYLTGLATAAVHALGLVGKPDPSVEEIAYIGRVISAVAGVITVALVGVLATRLYSRRAGFYAAALMAVIPLEVMQTHYASVDVLQAMFGALTLLLSWRLAERGGALAALLAGVPAGLAFGTKYTGVVTVVAPLWTALELAWPQRAFGRLLGLSTAVLAGFVVGALVACPLCFSRHDQVLIAMRWLRNLDSVVFFAHVGNHVPAPGLGWYGHRVLYQLVASLPYALGWPLYLAAMLAIAAAIHRHARADRLLVVLLLASFAGPASLGASFPRYLLPLFAPLVVLVAAMLCPTGRSTWIRATAFSIVMLYSLALTVSQVRRFSFDQQRDLVLWLHHELIETGPPGVKPLVAYPDNLSPYNGLGRMLAFGGFAQEPRPRERWLAGAPSAFILPHFVANCSRRDDPTGRIANTIAQLQSGTTGYRAAREWRTGFVDDWLYTWLDPVFEGDLWQGSIGFTVYLPDTAGASGQRPSESAR
jgi:4-amino-4-deoxy-L-arabinose transferase-like glycosyltransferase